MHRMIAIHKFGGTSLGDASRIRNAARLLAAARRRRPVVAVASAMGGVTAVLRQAARDAERGHIGLARKAVEALNARHAAAAKELGVRFEAAPLRELSAALEGVALLRERTARVTDLVSSFGERLSAPLLAGALTVAGVPARAVDARELLITDDRHGAATCDRKRSDPRVRRKLRPILSAGILPVVTSFIARSAKGEMTYFGAKVLHFPAVLPAIAEGIPLVIRNSFRPEIRGTTIASRGDGTSGIRAVTAVPGMFLLSLDGRGMTGIPGIAARVF